MPTLIRDAEAGDFVHIAEITNWYIERTPIHFGYQPVTPDELRAAWEKARARYPFLVAHFDGAFAGYAKAGVWRERRAYGWTAEAGIYVDRAYHKRGIGKALYLAIIQRLRDGGFHSVLGGVTLPNDASVRLHESLGFTKVSHVQHAGWKFGQWHDVGFWQLMLRGDDHRVDQNQA